MLVHEYLTGGGLAGQDLPASWAAEGRAMRRALAEDFAALHGIEVVATLDARLPDEPGPWRVARVEPGEEPAALERLAAEADGVVLIAPEADGRLLERARAVERAGGRSLGSAPEAIALASDKWALHARWRERDLPTPPTARVRPREGLPSDFPYPAVLKPIDGAGAVGTYYVPSPRDLPAAALEGPAEALLQAFVPGEPLSASFLVARGDAMHRDNAYLIGIARQWVRRRGDALRYEGGSVPYPHRVPAGLLRRALRSVDGLAGWVGVDFIWDWTRGELTLLEINPRPTTSYLGWRRLFARGDLPGRWLLALERPALLFRGPDPTIARLPTDLEAHFAADGSPARPSPLEA